VAFAVFAEEVCLCVSTSSLLEQLDALGELDVDLAVGGNLMHDFEMESVCVDKVSLIVHGDDVNTDEFARFRPDFIFERRTVHQDVIPINFVVERN